MHELGLIDQAVQMALARAEQDGAARVYRLTVRIGPLAGVEIDALRFAFEVVTQDTAAAGAELHIEEVPVRCWCATCASVPANIRRCSPGARVRPHLDGDFLT
jgi:hydrogenase nickel incorporation protein HypA/HybF